MSTDQQIMNDFAELLKENMALKERVRELEAGQQPQPEVNPNDDAWAANMRLKSKTALISIIRSERRDASTPSVLLPFSESEIEQMGERYRSSLRGTSVELVSPNMVAAYNSALRFANTKAVSIDKIVDVVKEWILRTIDADPNDPQFKQDEWIKAHTDLHTRLSKLNTTSP